MLSASQASSPADAAVRDYLDTSPARRRTCAKDEEGGTAGGQSAQAILQTLPPASCAQLPSILSKKLAAAVLADLASTDCKWDSTSVYETYLCVSAHADFSPSLSMVELRSASLRFAYLERIVEAARGQSDTRITRREWLASSSLFTIVPSC